MRGVALLDQGWSQAQVSRHLGVTPAAVSQWNKIRREQGETALRSKPHPGPRPKLNDRQVARLEKMLLQGPCRHGWSTELWTLSRVVQLIERKFDVGYDPSGVWHLLRRMGWSAQKPERRARERNEEAIVAWRKGNWPRIKKRQAKRAKHRIRR